jgi:hypothetical protein
MIRSLFLLLLLALLYWFPVRRWFNSWGTTADEVRRSMLGDEVIEKPTSGAMLAVTINAPPENIWPWLLQLGYQRGGLYSYDWLDRLFGFLDRPSAKRILPEFQNLAIGDKIPWGHGESLAVAVIDPYRSLVLDYKGRGMEWVWQFGLYPLDGSRTRLVTRGIERTPTTLAWRLGMLIMEAAAFIMTRRMLLNLKQRAEELTSFPNASSTEVPPAARRHT